jgi:arylsulfatase A-like enzyme
MGAADSANTKPNVVLILADDLRPDGLAALGNPIVKTPNLDKLVASGFVFRRAYCMGAMTTGVCFPSRTMLLTGMSLFRCMNLTQDGKVGSGGTANEFTFPKAMQAAGYATLHVGKKGLSPLAITNEFEETVDPGEAARVADVAVDFIRHKAGTQPMFLYIAGHEPHDPQYCPE